MSDLCTRYKSRIEYVSEQLAESCPELSQESRLAFAAQITIAALRAARSEHREPYLYELGGRNN
jgi:hypothetical protein